MFHNFLVGLLQSKYNIKKFFLQEYRMILKLYLCFLSSNYYISSINISECAGETYNTF